VAEEAVNSANGATGTEGGNSDETDSGLNIDALKMLPMV